MAPSSPDVSPERLAAPRPSNGQDVTAGGLTIPRAGGRPGSARRQRVQLFYFLLLVLFALGSSRVPSVVFVIIGLVWGSFLLCQ